MPKSRRQFLTVTSMGILGAASALRSQGQNPAAPESVRPPARRAARLRSRPGRGPGSVRDNLRRGRKARAVRNDSSRARRRRRQLAQDDGRPLRAAHRPAQTRVAHNNRSCDALGSDPPRPEIRSRARPLRAQLNRSRPAARARRRHRLRHSNATLALDRNSQTHLRAPHQHLSEAPASSSIPSCTASSR